MGDPFSMSPRLYYTSKFHTPEKPGCKYYPFPKTSGDNDPARPSANLLFLLTHLSVPLRIGRIGSLCEVD